MSAEVTVVVCAAGGEDAGGAIGSIEESAGAARQRLEIVLVTQGVAPAVPGVDRAIAVFPAGAAYARNRGLALASAPTVAFLDADERVAGSWAAGALSRRGRELLLGPVVGGSGAGRPGLGRPVAAAYARDLLLAAGGFDLSASTSSPRRGPDEWEALLRLERTGATIRLTPGLLVRRDRRAGLRAGFQAGRTLGRLARRRREPRLAVALRSPGALAGAFVGLARPGRLPPPHVLELAPPMLAAELAVRRIEPLPVAAKGKLQFLYRVDEQALLHVHVEPTPALAHAVEAREPIRTRSGAGGIPRLLAAVPAADALWVLEELLPGTRPRPGDADRWLGPALDWTVAMAGTGGPALGTTPVWRAHRHELLSAAPPPLAEAIASAATLVDELPSVHMHGDLQPANLVLGRHGVGAVDWEGAWLHGIPGLDLAYLALLARGALDPPPLERLAEAPGAGSPLADALRRLGLGEAELRAALLVVLASWSEREGARRRRLGAPPPPARFRPLLERLAPLLAGRRTPPVGGFPSPEARLS